MKWLLDGCSALLVGAIATSIACSELVWLGLACCKLPLAVLKSFGIVNCETLIKNLPGTILSSQWSLTVPVLLRTALSYYQLLCNGLVWFLLLWAALLKHDLKNLAKRCIHSKKLRKSSNSVWEGDTSMSPRCSETSIFFEKLHMYKAFCIAFLKGNNLVDRCFL